MVIVAGDVSHDLETLEATLRMVRGLGCEVFFVPGNHEAWVGGRGNPESSLEKLKMVRELCLRMGVRVDNCLVGVENSSPVWITPLLS